MEGKADRSNKLREYFINQYKISPDKIGADSSLLYDFEIFGDDVDEFFSLLIKDFNIDVKRLNLSRFYVGEEPFDFLSPIIRFVKGKNKNSKPTITVGDIERFIETGILE